MRKLGEHPCEVAQYPKQRKTLRSVSWRTPLGASVR